MCRFFKYLKICNNLLFFLIGANFIFANTTSFGTISVDFSFLNNQSKFIPDVESQISLPVNFSDLSWTEISSNFKFGFTAKWNNHIKISVGNLSFSGLISSLKNPEFSMGQSPFTIYSFPEVGFLSSFSGTSFSKVPLSIDFLFASKNKKLSFMTKFSENKESVVAVAFPLELKKIKITNITMVGVYFLDSTFLGKDDSWFSVYSPYKEDLYMGIVQEFRIQSLNSKNRILFGLNENPKGGFNPWINVTSFITWGLFSLQMGCFSTFSSLQNFIVADGSNLRVFLQGFLFPQVKKNIRNRINNWVKFGVIFVLECNESKDFYSRPFMDGILKIGFELELGFMRFRLSGGYINFVLQDKFSVAKNETYITGKLNMSFRNFFVLKSVVTNFTVKYYPEIGFQKETLDLLTSLSINPERNNGNIAKIFPKISVGNDVLFSKGKCKSVTINLVATWHFPCNFCSVRGSLGLDITKKL